MFSLISSIARNMIELYNSIYLHCTYNQIRDKSREHSIVVLLDSKSRIISSSIVSIGTPCYTIMHPREIYQSALLRHASSILLIHNHPFGSEIPSTHDIEISTRLAKTGTILGIPLIDHVIVTPSATISLKTIYPNIFSPCDSHGLSNR